jgi:hypothetical protein
MILYTEDKSNIALRLDAHFSDTEITVEFMGGVQPTSIEMLDINTDTRAEDKLGEITINTVNSYFGDNITFEPLANGIISWVKIFRTDNPESILISNYVSATDSGNVILDKVETVVSEDGEDPILNTCTGVYLNFK